MSKQTPDQEWERLAQMRCAACGAAIERVSYAVYIAPFTQMLTACSDNCRQDLEANVGSDDDAA